LPVESSHATSKQNDLRRMSNDCAVDLALVSEPSTRTVTSGSAGIACGSARRCPPGRLRARSREASDAPLANRRRSVAAPAAYRRNAARVAAAVELKYPGGSAKPRSWNARPLVRAPVAGTGEVERPDVHDRLEPAEFVAGRLDVPAAGADGSVDPLLVRPARVPRTRAPDQASEAGEARSASGRLPVDRDRRRPSAPGRGTARIAHARRPRPWCRRRRETTGPPAGPDPACPHGPGPHHSLHPGGRRNRRTAARAAVRAAHPSWRTSRHRRGAGAPPANRVTRTALPSKSDTASSTARRPAG